MSLTLLEVWRAARARAVALAGESAGYLVLAACDEIALLPRRVRIESLELQSDGALRVSARESSNAEQSELDLREILAQLLSVASATGPALSRVASRAQLAQSSGLGSELEKALIPLNRSAARRALVRLYRETSRAIQAGRLAPSLPVPLSVPASEKAVVEPVAIEETALPEQLSPFPPPLREVDRDALTSPQTVVARIRAGYRSVAPALPPQPTLETPRTPRLGSLEVSALTPPPSFLFENLGRVDDSTERTPEVSERFDTDIAELSGPAAFGAAFGDLESALETAAALEPSPSPRALVIGVDVADSEDAAARVADDDLEPLELVPSNELGSVLETPTPLLALGVAGVATLRPESGMDEGDELDVSLEPEAPARLEVSEPLTSSELEASAEADEASVAHAAAAAESEEAAAEAEALPVPPPPVVEMIPYPGLPAEQSSVRTLLDGFQVARPTNEIDLRRELSALAGVDLTPGSSSEVRPR